MTIECLHERVPAAGAPEQLMVMLHGFAQDAGALLPLSDALAAAFPQGAVLLPESTHAAEGGRNGRMWYPVHGLEGDPARWAERVSAVLDTFEPWLRAQQQRLGVGPAATCIGGFSQGAVLALELAARRDGIAGRVLSFGGRMVAAPERAFDRPLEHTTLHFLHGDADEVFAVDWVRKALERMAEVQGDATLDVAHGVGHRLHPALIECALHRLRSHIPRRTWQAALGAVPARVGRESPASR